MLITIILAVIMMSGLFLLLWSGVALIQDKRYFTSAPKEIQDAVQPRPERFPHAHALGFFLVGCAILSDDRADSYWMYRRRCERL